MVYYYYGLTVMVDEADFVLDINLSRHIRFVPNCLSVPVISPNCLSVNECASHFTELSVRHVCTFV